ncbi:MAG: lipoyl(octanoyl) transferase LipB [Planctomycetota bacterium]
MNATTRYDAPPLTVRWLRRRPYDDILREMRAAVAARADGDLGDELWLVEHEGVYTRGRRLADGEVLVPDLEVREVERGGRVTWHGPGQLVAYPIVALEGRGRDLHAFLRLLEDTVIDVLAGLGLEGRRDPAGTGVFVGPRKVASIGIAVRRWTTFHGLALNLDPDLEVFRAIRPCGFEAGIMTSLARELGPEALPTLAGLGERVAAAFHRRWRAWPRA